MKIKEIKSIFFRNYSSLNLETDKKFNFLISPNGMGKTNLLELIYFLSHLRSFRSVNEKELIKKGESYFFAECSYINNENFYNVKIKYKSDKKEVYLNEKKIRKYSDILGKFLTVYFGSEDISIITGSPVIRRKFFDIFFSVLDREYLNLLIEFKNIIKKKNFVLKKKDLSLISVYNKQLSNIIFYIQKKREEFIKKINLIFNNYYSEIGNFIDKTNILYIPSIEGKDNPSTIYSKLDENKNKEIEFGYSFLGIHRDQYIFLINGINFNKYASFGQTRLAALILKIIQAIFYKEKYNTSPILLLDDVILELDKERKKRFLNFISNFDQCFITITDRSFIEFIDDKNQVKEIEIEYGKIK